MRAPPQAIVFDLDGTLIDSRRDLCGSVQTAFRSEGLPVPAFERVSASVGHGGRALIQLLMAEAKTKPLPKPVTQVELSTQALPPPEVDDAQIERLLEAFRDDYLEHLLVHTAPYAGILELLDTLQSRPSAPQLAVLTNKPGEMARRSVEGLELGGYFGAGRVLGPDDVGVLKPDPAGLLGLLSVLGVAPKDAAYVGDMPVDYEVACAAGCRGLLVSWGLERLEVLEATGASEIVHSPGALLTQLFPAGS